LLAILGESPGVEADHWVFSALLDPLAALAHDKYLAVPFSFYQSLLESQANPVVGL
jgi:hypothetical protein